ILEIENIEDLITLGYYDDYDSEMGWDYRDESLDDDFEVFEDSEEDDLGSDFYFGEEDDEDQVGLLECSYRQRVVAQARDVKVTEEEEEEEEEEDVESSVAEDELIHRLVTDQFL
ncbi:hypothetical protein BGZ95_005889, partial [Linnemannia exigua]